MKTARNILALVLALAMLCSIPLEVGAIGQISNIDLDFATDIAGLTGADYKDIFTINTEGVSYDDVYYNGYVNFYDVENDYDDYNDPLVDGHTYEAELYLMVESGYVLDDNYPIVMTINGEQIDDNSWYVYHENENYTYIEIYYEFIATKAQLIDSIDFDTAIAGFTAADYENIVSFGSNDVEFFDADYGYADQVGLTFFSGTDTQAEPFSGELVAGETYTAIIKATGTKTDFLHNFTTCSINGEDTDFEIKSEDGYNYFYIEYTFVAEQKKISTTEIARVDVDFYIEMALHVADPYDIETRGVETFYATYFEGNVSGSSLFVDEENIPPYNDSLLPNNTYTLMLIFCKISDDYAFAENFKTFVNGTEQKAYLLEDGAYGFCFTFRAPDPYNITQVDIEFYPNQLNSSSINNAVKIKQPNVVVNMSSPVLVILDENDNEVYGDFVEGKQYSAILFLNTINNASFVNPSIPFLVNGNRADIEYFEPNSVTLKFDFVYTDVEVIEETIIETIDIELNTDIAGYTLRNDYDRIATVKTEGAQLYPHTVCPIAFSGFSIDSPIEGGATCSGNMAISEKNGYVFSDNLEIYINGRRTEFMRIPITKNPYIVVDIYSFTVQETEPISSLEISFSDDIAGLNLDYRNEFIRTDTEHTSVAGLNAKLEGSDSAMGPGNSFIAGSTYTFEALVCGEFVEGDLSVTINGVAADSVTKMAYNLLKVTFSSEISGDTEVDLVEINFDTRLATSNAINYNDFAEIETNHVYFDDDLYDGVTIYDKLGNPCDKALVAGQKYTATLWLSFAGSLVVSEDLEVKINGAAVDAANIEKLSEGERVVVKYSFVAQGKPVDSIELEFTTNIAGLTHDDNDEILRIGSDNVTLLDAQSGMAGYDGLQICAGKTFGGVPYSGKLVAGKTYTAEIIMTTKAGYKFDDTVAVKINGSLVDADAVTVSDALGISTTKVYFTFTASDLVTIDALDLDFYPARAGVNAKAYDTIFTVKTEGIVPDDEDFGYSGNTLYIMDSTGADYTGKLVAGKKYTAKIFLAVKNGYSLADDFGVRINGKLIGANLFNTYNISGYEAICVEYAFTAKVNEPISSIDVDFDADIAGVTVEDAQNSFAVNTTGVDLDFVDFYINSSKKLIDGKAYYAEIGLVPRNGFSIDENAIANIGNIESIVWIYDYPSGQYRCADYWFVAGDTLEIDNVDIELLTNCAGYSVNNISSIVNTKTDGIVFTQFNTTMETPKIYDKNNEIYSGNLVAGETYTAEFTVFAADNTDLSDTPTVKINGQTVAADKVTLSETDEGYKSITVTYTFVAAEPIEISNIDLDFSTAIAGMTHRDYQNFITCNTEGLEFEDEDLGYSPSNCGFWVYDNGDDYDGALVDGETYNDSEIYLAVKPGYALADGWTVTINGVAVDPSNLDIYNSNYTAICIYNDFTVDGTTEYNATFVADGVTVATIPYTPEDKDITPPEVPAKVGYTGAWEEYELTAGNITVNAVYEINEYTVKWVIDDEEIESTLAFGAEIVKPENPVKAGYVFRGWTPAVPETVPTNDVTFTAVFEKSDAFIKNNTGSKTISYGERLELTANATGIPTGGDVVWYINGEEVGRGIKFTAPEATSDYKITIKIVDASGNAVKNERNEEITDTEQVKVSGGFFQKLVSFIKNLFNMSRIITQAFKF